MTSKAINPRHLVLAVFATLALGSCYVNLNNAIGNCIEGQGEQVSEARNLASFQRISLDSSANVYLTQGSPQSVEVVAPANLLDRIETTVEGDTMRIKTRDCISTDKPIDVYVTVPKLQSLTINGSGSIEGETPITSDSLALSIPGSGTIDLDVTANSLRANIDGSGDINLAGAATSSTMSIAGSGAISGFGFTSNTCAVSIDGSGSAQVHVLDELSVAIDGSGSVAYRGNPPETSFDVQGSGSIDRVD